MVNTMVEVVWQWPTTRSGNIKMKQIKMSCKKNTSVSNILHTISIDVRIYANIFWDSHECSVKENCYEEWNFILMMHYIPLHLPRQAIT